ncbi:carbon-nitrogen hydrolase family protein [Ruminococcus albus]|uniref:N-carbamoylputrescine amidase n=1 Tax=Ruminococcus albus TaxID=1264 RepID=A0A1I1JNE9_RUMAL|nr:carbon-nitrogen hydrolase family protein [Ruminococcus albus]SFC46940.1 N-carbamoylputrescine amidase [Ruminococcus albus]
MKLALCQMQPCERVRENMEQSLRYIREAAENGADLILFPEVQLTPFFPQFPGQDVSAFAVTMNSDTVRAFQNVCRECKIMAVPNLYLRENDKYFDASILIGADGSIIGLQKMVHIAQAEQFYEQDYYTPSDDGFKVFDTPFGKIGIVVCFDRHYPESIRTEALLGADLILIPTVNTKAEPSEMFECEVRVQAFQNSVAIAMCNRVGREDDMHFSGESIVTDANGSVIAKAEDTAQLLYAEFDISQSQIIRDKRPYTQLRRNEFYL